MKCCKCGKPGYDNYTSGQILIAPQRGGECYCLVHLMRELTKKNKNLKWPKLLAPFSEIVEFYKVQGLKVQDLPEMDIGEPIKMETNVPLPLKGLKK